MEVTSNHLEIGPPRIVDQEEVGEELSKRTPSFGMPVGKSAWFIHHPKLYPPSDVMVLDEPGVNPVLICKMRKGQELRIRCVAKKVRISYTWQYRNTSSSSSDLGNC